MSRGGIEGLQEERNGSLNVWCHFQAPFLSFTYLRFSNIIKMLRSVFVDNSYSDFLPMLSISREKAKKNLEEAKNYITLDLRNISAILSDYHPLEIARMSVWEARKVERQSRDEHMRSTYRLFPILIQSVLVSDLFTPSSNNRNVKSKDWQRILALGEDVARKLSRYIDNLVILNLSDGRITRENVMDYRDGLYAQFFPSEKSHDILRRERAVAEAGLEDVRASVQETFCVSPERLIKDLYDISDSAIDSIDELVNAVSAFKAEVEEKAKKIRENDPSLSEDGAMRMVYNESGMRAESLRLSGLRDDFDLFRPEFSSDISNETMDALSSELGKVDMLSLLFDDGLWSATCYPFIKLGGMYFTFVARYLLAIYQRFSETVMHIGSRVSASADTALSSLFTATDVVGVYSFNGRKLDVEVLSSLGEINLVSDPELWEQRMKRRSIEMEAHPQPGHMMLILNPDGDEELESIGEGIFLSSVLHLLRIRDDSSLRLPFYEKIFGPSTESVEPESSDDDIFDDDETFSVEEIDNEPDDLMFSDLDDDDYISDGEMDDEEDEDYPDPYEVERMVMSDEERERNERVYESNHERVISELEKDVDNGEYEIVDEDEIDNSGDGSADEDDYEDPDQLDFLDLLDDYDSEDDGDEEEGENEDPGLENLRAEEEEIDSSSESEDLAEELYTRTLDEMEEQRESYEEKREAEDPPSEETLLKEEEKQNVLKEIEEEENSALSSEKETSDSDSLSVLYEKEDDIEEPSEPAVTDAVEGGTEACSDSPEEIEDDCRAQNAQVLPEDDLDLSENGDVIISDESTQEPSLPDEEAEESEESDDVLDGIEREDEADEYFELEADDNAREDDEESLPELEELYSGKMDESALNSSSQNGGIVLEYDDGSDEGFELDERKYSRIISEIVHKIEGDATPLYSFLEKEDKSVIDYFDEVIRKSWEKQSEDGKDKMFSVFEYDMSLLLSKGRIYDELRMQELMNNAGAVMYSQGKSRWNALLLYINRDYEVESAKMISLDRSSFTSSNWKIVTNIAEALIARKGR